MKENVGDVFKILPSVPFDLHCGGVKRKQQEAIAVYIVSVVNAFFNDAYKNLIPNSSPLFLI